MTENQLELLRCKMNDAGWREVCRDVKFNELHCFSLGKDKFAFAVWNKKEEVPADEKDTYRLQMLGDPHCTGSYKYRYDTPFTKTECVVCIAPLGITGELKGGLKWLHGKSHSAYDYEGGRREVTKHHDIAFSEFSFRGAQHSFCVKDYVDMTDMDAVGAWIMREAKGITNNKRFEKSYTVGETAEEKAQKQAAAQERMQVYAAVCSRLMSAEERKRWKRIENFSKLRKAVAAIRVTLAQKIGAKFAKAAKQMSAGRGK